MAAQRSADSYGEWVDKGELADMKEVNGKCRCCWIAEFFEMIREGILQVHRGLTD